MTNIFGNDKVYICPHCGSDNVGAEFIFYGEYNKPYEAPSIQRIYPQRASWCYDCNKEIMVVEKE